MKNIIIVLHPPQAQEFAKGKELVSRYWLSKNSSYKETTFFISGADKAISEILKSEGLYDEYVENGFKK